MDSPAPINSAEHLLNAATRVLETLAGAAPLRDVLDLICLDLQHFIPGSCCGVVLVDAEGTRLHFGGGPSLPADFVHDIDRLRIDHSNSPIPHAIHQKQPVILADLPDETDFIPASFAEIPIRAVWAIPALNDLSVTAVLVAFFTSPRAPSLVEQALLSVGTRFIQVAIVQHTLRLDQRDSAEIFRLISETIPVAMVLTRIEDSRVIYINQCAGDLFGIPVNAAIGEIAPDYWRHPTERKLFVERVLAHGLVNDFEAELLNRNQTPFWALLTAKPTTFRGDRVIITGVIDITVRKQAELALRSSEEKFQTLFRSNPDLMSISTVKDGRYLEVNEQFCRLLGYNRDEVIGYSALDLGVWGNAEDRSLVIRALQNQQRVVNFETRFRRRNGHFADVLLSAEFIEFNGDPCLFSIARDVSELRQADAELRLTYRIFESVAEGIVVTDAEQRIIWVNPAFSVVTEFTPGEVVGQTPRILASGRHNAEYFAEMWRAVDEFDSWQGEIWNRRKNGDIFPEWLSITAVRDRDGRLTHYVGVFSDISQQKMAAETIHLLSTHDALTRLPNRSLFTERVEHALSRARQENRTLAVLLVDLDRFKVINDSLGHTVGDRMLQLVANRLRECVGEQDLVARLGGDEFGILTESVTAEQAGDLAERLLSALARPISLTAEQDLSITPSIGICVYPGFGDDALTMLKHGDIAMYRAKADGRNTFRFFSPDMIQHSMEHLAMENKLRRAIQRGELFLAYQPRVDLLTQRVVGVEALIRWRHPELGLIPPIRFIPLAEETGLIHIIGRWVIHTACAQAKAWLDAGFPPLRMSVNLSANQFHEGHLAESIAATLRDTGLDAELLEVEVTESNVMADADEAVRILESLKQLGVSVSIDDFGTGYSSLSYLKRFPIDAIKIDRSFVMDIPHDANDSAIAQAVISLGHSLGLKVVAEGVETLEQLAFLRGNDCDEIQGYLFSKPLPPEELVELLQRTQGIMSV